MRDSYGDGNVLCLDSIKVIVLVSIWYDSFARCYFLGKADEDTQDLSVFMCHNCVALSSRIHFLLFPHTRHSSCSHRGLLLFMDMLGKLSLQSLDAAVPPYPQGYIPNPQWKPELWIVPNPIHAIFFHV